MTKEEFLHRYHDFRTPDIAAAKAECSTITIDGDQAVVVGPLVGEFCLMLKSVAEFIGTLKAGVVIVE